MVSRASTKAHRFKITGPVGFEDARSAQIQFDAQSINVGGQYLNCRRGGERGRALLYHLVEVGTGEVVGFMGFETTMLIYGKDYPPDAMLSIEYVYIMPKYQKQGLSRLFLDVAIDVSCRWINEQVVNHRDTGITCRSASIGESDAGVHLLETFDQRLRTWCNQNEVEFKGHDGR